MMPKYEFGDTFKSLPIKIILKYHLAICQDYAKFTSALLWNIYPDSELCFVKIPQHVATAIKINNKMYVLDQHLPVLTLEKWVQVWIEKLKFLIIFKKKKLKVDFISILKNKRVAKTGWVQYTRSERPIRNIDTNKIVKELKRTLKIKEINKGSKKFKYPLEITVPPLRNYAYYYGEDEITNFSIITAIKNKIEDELVGDFREILDLTIGQKDRDLVLKIQLVSERNEAQKFDG